MKVHRNNAGDRGSARNSITAAWAWLTFVLLRCCAAASTTTSYFVHPFLGADVRAHGRNRTFPFRTMQFAVNAALDEATVHPTVAPADTEVVMLTDDGTGLRYSGGELCVQNLLGGGSLEEVDAAAKWHLEAGGNSSSTKEGEAVREKPTPA